MTAPRSALTGSSAAPGAFDLVVLAASLGGPGAVRAVVANLPAWFPAAVIVVQHRSAVAQHLCVELLRRRARLEVVPIEEGERLRPGTVHVAPADRQVVLESDWKFARLVGPPRRGHSADALIASAAERLGARVIGVILSGANDDGAAGAVALKRAGGRMLAQDRASAGCFTMPAAAIATGCVDLVLPLERIAPALISLVMWPLEPPAVASGPA
ncbi:MAG TPA: chemotaxis protein CheB [Chloroflexota bacterium]